MSETVHLRGMTWDHSRGFDPMLATSTRFGEMRPGVEITWEKRSLQAFADRPIGEMAAAYDLMVIDHPHVGEARGLGLMCALEIVKDRAPGEEFDAADQVGARIHNEAMGRGMFSRMRDDVFCLAPPIVTSENELDRITEIVRDSVVAVLG